MLELEQIIRHEIDAQGAISFARFMELALYHPAHGYYERNLQQTGRSGDFYTSVSVGPLYGEILAFDFAQRLSLLQADKLYLIEAGAHDGQLASDVLNYLQEYQKELFPRLQYLIIEPSLARFERQFQTLAPYAGKVEWVKNWDQIPEFNGICFSNELLDAMPVHLFRWSTPHQAWAEWGVTCPDGPDGAFQWNALPPAQTSERAQKLLNRLPPELQQVLPDQFTVEVSPDGVSWWLQAAHRLDQGFLFTADYGFLQEDFYSPHRAHGTLRTYSKHHSGTDLLDAVGEQDITAHVNFSLLINAGESAGLDAHEFVQQGSYVKNVLEKIQAQPARFPLWTSMRYRQLMSLIHPEHLGRVFKVLIQSRSQSRSQTGSLTDQSTTGFH